MPRIDIHQHITDHIVAAIEAGAGKAELPWHRPGVAASMPVNVSSSKPYNGINVLMLWAASEAGRYSSGTWGTYKQWQDKGAQVRKGEKSTAIVFYKELPVSEKSQGSDEDEEEKYFVARSFRVFNADQVDGWKEPALPEKSLVERIEETDAFVAATGADIRHGGARAYFRPGTDFIQMPDEERFTGTATSTPTEGYYSTLLHELTHWTGHESRLARDMSGRFGKESYAMEELVAELGAAFLCAELQISPQPRPDHAAYIASWLKVLKEDKRAIFSAASKASQAGRHLHRLQEKVQDQPTTEADTSAMPEPNPSAQDAEPESWQLRVSKDGRNQIELF